MTPSTDDRLARLRAAADAPDLAGTKYRLVDSLGRGGMGTVYRVIDTDLDREVALKVLSMPDPSGDLSKRLLMEARVLARLEHPNIVPIHDVGVLPDGRVFYLMKLVRGTRLDSWARQEGRSQRDVLRLFQRVCEAAAFAHAHGVIHRDLKPGNVMVGAFGEALVMDWGVARIVHGEREPQSGTGPGSGVAPQPALTCETAPGTVIGTRDFMSPEQARGDVARVDARSDIWSLGATLRALLGGEAPAALQAVIERCCAPSPDDRYHSALDVAADVGAHLDGLRVSVHRESLVERAKRVLHRHRILVALILAYLVMRLMILAVF